MDADFRHEEGFFNTKDHLRLFWQGAAPKDAGAVKAHVILLHGYQDHSGRYAECLRRLAKERFQVHAFDCRGHGQSDGRRGYCDSFKQYENDLGVFLDRVLPQAKNKKLFILAHANGGLIAAHWALSRPPAIAGVVFTCPFLGEAVKIPAAKMLGARVIGKLVPWLPFRSELDTKMLSHDAEWQRATDRDPLYLRTVTPRYFFEARNTQYEVLRRASEFQVPSLFLTAGDDPVVSTPASRQFFEKIASADKQYKEYAGLFHEILAEVGKDQVYADLLAWLNARAS
jgi:lysophospholipase